MSILREKLQLIKEEVIKIDPSNELAEYKRKLNEVQRLLEASNLNERNAMIKETGAGKCISNTFNM